MISKEMTRAERVRIATETIFAERARFSESDTATVSGVLAARVVEKLFPRKQGRVAFPNTYGLEYHNGQWYVSRCESEWCQHISDVRSIRHGVNSYYALASDEEVARVFNECLSLKANNGYERE